MLFLPSPFFDLGVPYMHPRTRQDVLAIFMILAVGSAIGWAGSQGSSDFAGFPLFALCGVFALGVNWLVFVLLFIIPVYPIIFGLVDLWVFNTIEFWSGESVVASKDTPDGGRVLTERTADPKTARLRHISAQGELLAELYIRRESDEHFELLDREGRVLASVSGREHITMRDAEGRKISALNPRQMRRIKVAIEQGASPAEQAWEAMETKDESMRMLAMSETIRERVIF